MPQTYDYEMFSLRPDNRKKISPCHIESLTRSMDRKNLLHIRPIIVNKDMEIVDGQHRFLAAKKLNLPIFYEIHEDFEEADIVKMNYSKSWNNDDYLNFYCKSGKDEYLKARSFIQKHGLSVRAITYVVGKENHKISFSSFKDGTFIFDLGEMEGVVDLCTDTLEVLKDKVERPYFLKSYKFWTSLFNFIKQVGLENMHDWIEKVELLSNRISAKATRQEYLECLTKVYNYRKKAGERFNEKG